MSTYQGKQVTVVRPAKDGDKGFVAGRESVIIRTADGKEETVAKDQVKD